METCSPGQILVHTALLFRGPLGRETLGLHPPVGRPHSGGGVFGGDTNVHCVTMVFP